jgi:hypothetical protein
MDRKLATTGGRLRALQARCSLCLLGFHAITPPDFLPDHQGSGLSRSRIGISSLTASRRWLLVAIASEIIMFTDSTILKRTGLA